MAVRRDGPTGGALFSECGRYRYALWRQGWLGGGDGDLVVIGLNPSTADAEQDDPTIRRCMRFARDWGHDRLVMLNLFGLRSTDPTRLRGVLDPVGQENNAVLRSFAHADYHTATVVCAWGARGTYRDRGMVVAAMLRAAGVPLWAFGLTNSGQPRHPLYLRADSRPVEYLP